MTEKLKNILAQKERYEGFTPLDTPTPFSAWAKGKEYETVQVHDSSVFEFDGQEDIVGFVGAFTWKDGMDILVEAGKW